MNQTPLVFHHIRVERTKNQNVLRILQMCDFHSRIAYGETSDNVPFVAKMNQSAQRVPHNGKQERGERISLYPS